MHAHQRGERGSISMWLVLLASGLTLLVGLAVDLGGQVDAQQRARALAGEAARAGAQALGTSSVDGAALVLSHTEAAKAARTYLAAADTPGTVRVAGDTVTVTVAQTYPSQVLSVIGIRSLSVSGTAQAQAVRVLQGAQR